MGYPNIKIKRLNEGFYEPGDSYYGTPGDYKGKITSPKSSRPRHLRQLRNLSNAVQELQELGLSDKRIMQEVQTTLEYQGY